MTGPYFLTKEEVDRVIPENVIGNYAYGESRKDENGQNLFTVKYVGRADAEPLRDRIKHGIEDGYKEFKFSIAQTEEEAFEKECKNWHDFGGPKGILDNQRHPDKPDGTNYTCPYCEEEAKRNIQLKLERPRFRR